jgi:integrase
MDANPINTNSAPRHKRAAHKQRLTELSVRRAKPGIVWDTQQRGLALRTQPTGRKTWYAVYSRHGRPRWMRLGDANTMGLAEARTLAGEARVAVDRGRDPAAERKAERGAGTFAELHDRYLEQHAKRVNKSWQQADALIRRNAMRSWGKLQASAITRADVKQMMARLQDSPIAANQTLAAVSAVFSWGMKEELIAANPCKLVGRNPTQSRERVLSESEVPQVWAAFGDLDPVTGAALRMILLSGQRPGEVAHMRREHVKDGWWEMPGELVAGIWPGTKNGASHRVWLPQPARALLAERADGRSVGYLFAGERGRPVSGLDRAMRDICKKLGVESVRPHDLRRTHGTTITKLKFGREAMNRIQNHKEGGIADVYDVHEYADENKHIMESVAAYILALAAGKPAESNVVPLAKR